MVQRTYARAAELLDQTSEYDLLIVDAADFDQGLAECRLLRETIRARIVLMVDECDATNIAEAFRSDVVDGFLNKTVACEPLAGILRLVALGERYLPLEALEVFGPCGRSGSLHRKMPIIAPNLSGREVQILGCLTDGDSNKLISRRLQIADATVKVHVKSILRKLRVKNRTQAAIWAAGRQAAICAAQPSLAA